MGCAGSTASTGVAAEDVYRPPPTSFSRFDISSINEPWLASAAAKLQEDQDDDVKKPPATNGTLVPHLLDKLDADDRAPTSWSEVSKALEDLKPSLDTKPTATAITTTAAKPPPLRTVNTLDAGAKKPTPTTEPQPDPTEGGYRPVRDNAFILKDKEIKSQGGGVPSEPPKWRRRDPLEGYPEQVPPGAGGRGVVLYTTTLRGVRRTYEDCERARQLVEGSATEAGGIGVDERDVSMHGDFRRQLKELAGEGATVPQLFVLGRYIGGVEEVAMLAENGKLREMMRWAKAKGEVGKDGKGCGGCGGARFVPCWDCGGSCKVVVTPEAGSEGVVERCGSCNENGLMMCPLCH